MIDDKDHKIACMISMDMTHESIAKHLGVSRVSVTKRVGKIKDEAPWLLEVFDEDKFRANEATKVAEVRNRILQTLRNLTPKQLAKMSVPQLTTAYGTLYDKDEKLEQRRQLSEDVIKKIEYTPEEQEQLKQLMGLRTQRRLEEAKAKSKAKVQEAEVIASPDE